MKIVKNRKIVKQYSINEIPDGSVFRDSNNKHSRYLKIPIDYDRLNSFHAINLDTNFMAFHENCAYTKGLKFEILNATLVIE